MANALDDFTERSFTHDGTTHLVFAAGTGPAVIVIHEMPGSRHRSPTSPAASATPASACACRRCSESRRGR
jgi:hypothetical protein